MPNLYECKLRWERELEELSRKRDRWGETRRFIGRTVEARIARRTWLIDHIVEAEVALALEQEEEE